LHKAGFVHRDIKPSNFALGRAAVDCRTVYIFDFGLARQFGTWTPDGKFDLREPRSDVAFRGTVRYCSVNVHRRMEQGRHDDLWSLFYMLVELVVGGLPWRNAGRKETERLKATISERRLLSDCPREFVKILQHLVTLDYTKQPHYDHVRDQLQTVMKRKGYRANDPLDWEPNGRYSHAFRDTFTTETEEITADERRERDQTEGSDSLSDISDSESGAPLSTNEDSYAYDSEKQDTLNNLSGVQ
jgi:tau tubulin kinase